MPTVTAETPRDTITVAGKTFSVPQPYREGDTLKANEASALNQVYAENLRNNFASKVKAATEAGSFDEATFQTQFDEYAASYEFGVRTGGGGRTSDPVEAEALDIARDKVRGAIAKAGHKVSDYSAKAITDKAREVLQKYPDIRETARAIVAARNESAGDIDLSGMNETPASASAPQAKSKKGQTADAAPTA